MRAATLLVSLAVFGAGGLTGCSQPATSGDFDGGAGETTDAQAGSLDASSDDASAGDGSELDAGQPPGMDAGQDAGVEAGIDAGQDAGPPVPRTGCSTGAFMAFRGDLHAHTSYSDGKLTPADAFQYARQTAGLDILVLTDHVEQLYVIDLKPPFQNRYQKCQAQADSADVPGTFLAACGFEYGTARTSNGLSAGHNNVFFSPDIWGAGYTDFHDFYRKVATCGGRLGQFNHPGSDPTQTWNDFEYDAAADGKLQLFEFNGGGPVWDLYFAALDAGWHLSPMYDQDNHNANWGTADDGRSGFYMSSLSRAGLAEAMSARRTFMSMDKNASIKMLADGSCWMGSILKGYSSIGLQVDASDPDSGDGFVSIELYGPGKVLLGQHDCQGATSCTANFTLSGQRYALVRATQTDGDILVAAPIWME